jgi:predicted 3-demethylubiquinone-9 3-methyltransferase (glyoxalase superfamily)
MDMNKIKPCLWFDGNAEEAVRFYCSVFKDSKMGEVSHYGESVSEATGQPEGAVLTIEFSLNGTDFLALNGGPTFKFNEAVSLMIDCKDQEEVDYFWSRLTEGGEESMCGWLKDKYGLSWQVVPQILTEILTDKDEAKRDRVMKAMLQMRKIDIATLERAMEPAEAGS